MNEDHLTHSLDDLDAASRAAPRRRARLPAAAAFALFVVACLLAALQWLLAYVHASVPAAHPAPAGEAVAPQLAAAAGPALLVPALD